MQIKSLQVKPYQAFSTNRIKTTLNNTNSESVRFSNKKNLVLPLAALLTLATSILISSPRSLFATYSPQQTALIEIESLEKSKNIDAIIEMLNRPAKRSNPLYVRDFYTEKIKKGDAFTAAENALTRLITSQDTDIKTIEKLDESLQPKAKNRLKHYKPSYPVFDAINKRLGRNIEVKIYYKD